MPDKPFAKCPHCAVRPQSPGGNKWCLECRAEYQRNYRNGEIEKIERRGYIAGARAMRKAIAERFAAMKSARMDGPIAATIASQMDLIDGNIETPAVSQRRALIKSLRP